MDNKILSAAIIAALAAPMSAMADTTVYGQVHMSVGAVDSSESGAGADPFEGEDNMQVRNHASRLGFKGSEDLGGGLKANFMLEYSVDPDAGSGAGLGRRNQWIGLSGDNWGEFRVGRHDTPLKMAQGKFDQFNDTDADIGTLVNGEKRLDNVIAYLSPSWSGFSVAAAGIAGEDDKCDEAGRTALGVGCPTLPLDTPASDKTGLTDAYSLAAMYENGPLFASLAYDDYDAITNSEDEDSILRAIATYKFGDFQVGGLWETTEVACSNCDHEVWGLSGKFSLGNIDLKAQYLDGTYEDGVGRQDVEADQWTLGVDYNFSKRTTAYFMYTSLEADDSNAPAVTAEYDFTGVGMIHKF